MHGPAHWGEYSLHLVKNTHLPAHHNREASCFCAFRATRDRRIKMRNPQAAEMSALRPGLFGFRG